MIEYHAHIAALDSTQRTLGAIAGAGAEFPDGAARLASAIEDHRPIARLGSLLDTLLGHAASDVEVALLGKCAEMWRRALAIYEEIATARTEFELALLRDDIDDQVTVAQMGFDRLKEEQAKANAMEVELGALRAEVAGMPHLPRHPRQGDQPSSGWSSGDAFLGRRTLAFVAAMLANAPDDRSRALASGALAGSPGASPGRPISGTPSGDRAGCTASATGLPATRSAPGCMRRRTRRIQVTWLPSSARRQATGPIRTRLRSSSPTRSPSLSARPSPRAPCPTWLSATAGCSRISTWSAPSGCRILPVLRRSWRLPMAA